MTSRWQRWWIEGRRVATQANGYDASAGPLAQPLVALLAILFGLGASLGFAWFMYTLIHASEMRLSEVSNTQLLDFVRMKRSEAVQRKDRKPERPQVNEVPDAPPRADQSSSSGEQLAVSIDAPISAAADMGLDAGLGMVGGDGDYLPIVKVAPLYPRRALSRGIEGECLVRYSVTTAGTVKDVEVIAEECADEVFHRPSIEAAKRFKYKPRVVDGVAIEVRGVLNRFYFEREMAREAEAQ
jgi:protein TonB